MPLRICSLEEMFAAPYDSFVDVRSPAEFAEDHIPDAISLPVLSDCERARIGTIYTQESPFKARKIGAALVARNAAHHIENALLDRDGSWCPLVYCWRGGQRSGSFASILSQIGWRAETLEGGYRSYRRLVVGMLRESPLHQRLILLDGNTGTAKTELLVRLAAHGAQVLDLESLAAHRGSLFGAVGKSQPSQKSFESAIAKAFVGFDSGRPVVAEAESSKVGNLQVPASLWQAMRVAPRIRLTAPLDARARYLARAYSDVTNDQLVLQSTLTEFARYHGRDQIRAWQGLAAAGEFESLAKDLMQRHYDVRYGKSWVGRESRPYGEFAFDDLTEADIDRAADSVMEMVSRYG